MSFSPGMRQNLAGNSARDPRDFQEMSKTVKRSGPHRPRHAWSAGLTKVERLEVKLTWRKLACRTIDRVGCEHVGTFESFVLFSL